MWRRASRSSSRAASSSRPAAGVNRAVTISCARPGRSPRSSSPGRVLSDGAVRILSPLAKPLSISPEGNGHYRCGSSGLIKSEPGLIAGRLSSVPVPVPVPLSTTSRQRNAPASFRGGFRTSMPSRPLERIALSTDSLPLRFRSGWTWAQDRRYCQQGRGGSAEPPQSFPRPDPFGSGVRSELPPVRTPARPFPATDRWAFRRAEPVVLRMPTRRAPR